MTLVQAARHMEESGMKIKIGNFDSFEDFMSYFNAHYKPLLENLAGEWKMATDVRRFFTDDMLSAFSEEDRTRQESAEADDGINPTLREALDYVRENMDTDDMVIIRAQIDKNYSCHMNPAAGIDNTRVTDLLEEYGDEHDLPEGWWTELGEMDDILLML